jgi:hypothetical protein
MGKEGEGILVYYCIPQRDWVADVHAWPQGDLRTGDLRQRRDRLRQGGRIVNPGFDLSLTTKGLLIKPYHSAT